MKRTSNFNPKKDLKLTILYLLQNGFSPGKICKRFNWLDKKGKPQYSRLSYYLKEFKINKNVKRVGYGTWETAGKELQILTGYGKKDKRGHAFRHKLNFSPKMPWGQLKIYFWEKLEKANLKPYNIKGSGNIGLIFKKRRTWICKNGTIHIWFRPGESIFSKTAIESSKSAEYSQLSRIRALESILRHNLKINGKYQVECLKHHYAFVNSQLCKDYVKRGIRFRELRDPDTKELWGLIDESFEPGEFETQSKRTAIRDNDAIDSNLNVLRKDKDLLKNLIEEKRLLLEDAQLNKTMLKEMQEEITLITKVLLKRKDR